MKILLIFMAYIVLLGLLIATDFALQGVFGVNVLSYFIQIGVNIVIYAAFLIGLKSIFKFSLI